jgi:hypothetical protein
MLKVKTQNNLANLLMTAILLLFVAGQFLSLSHSFSHHENVKISKETPVEKHSKSDCVLCSFSNSLNQIIIFATTAFAVTYFYLAFFVRKFDRIKLSYLLTSNFSRAPPALS